MKKITNRLTKLINEPLMGIYYLKSKANKKKLYNDYSQISKKAQVIESKFILSFDCDTEYDIEVVHNVNNRLNMMGIRPVYAVPGELLEAGNNVYKDVLATGAEFINHGYRIHSIKTDNKYESTLDYCNITYEEIKEDIEKGHESIIKVLEIESKGFRTPHFGNFQKRNQLFFLHSILQDLKYEFSSSTIPYYAYRYGAVFNNFGLLEIPVTGLYSEPLRIYDSFLFYDNDKGCLDGSRYKAEGNLIADNFLKNKLNGIINIYADPSQIYMSDDFFEMMKKLSNISKNTTYSKLIQEIKEANENSKE